MVFFGRRVFFCVCCVEGGICVYVCLCVCVFISLHVCSSHLILCLMLAIGELYANATRVIGTWKRLLKSYLPSVDEEVRLCWSSSFLTFCSHFPRAFAWMYTICVNCAILLVSWMGTTSKDKFQPLNFLLLLEVLFELQSQVPLFIYFCPSWD